MLKLINPLYRNISIDNSSVMREALNSIRSQLLLTADVMEKEIDIMNDILAVPPNATDIPAGETIKVAETQELVDHLRLYRDISRLLWTLIYLLVLHFKV